jgi:hypothetical protein
MECIVTRNIKDYKDCELPVYLPDEIIDRLQK